VTDTHTDRSSDFPLANGAATRMLAEGLEAKVNFTQRALAQALGYKSSVVVSHMASGRAPIPIDRAVEIAEALDLDKGAFLLAVLEQRYPNTDFRGLLPESSGVTQPSFESDGDRSLLNTLEIIAGKKLSRLPEDKLAIVRDVLSDRDPGRRWLTLPELPIVEEMRRAAPSFRKDGIPPVIRSAILKALRGS
jgi:transcriptional regulator with XRE-family HTH domain